MSTPIRAVTWDVDGTLYSTRRLRLALMGAGLRALVTLRLGDVRELLRLGRPGVRPPALRPIEDRWFAPALRRIGPRPGVRAAIDAVAARGLPQGIVSDYEAAAKLEALGLAGRFAAVIAGERLGERKPSPTPFLAAAALLGVPPEAVLHVGDRDDRDGAGARAAGCRVAILGRDLRSPEEVVGLL